MRKKLDENGEPLKNWKIKMNRGIVTGLDKAFIIEKEKYDELTKKDRKNKELIVPLLRGKNIGRYECDFKDLYLVGTFPAKKINIDNYPSLKSYLETFLPGIQQTGKPNRKKTSNKWFETQDAIAYYEEFEKEKLIWAKMTKTSKFTYDTKGYYIPVTGFVMVGEKLKYLLAMLNSKLIEFAFLNLYGGKTLGEGLDFRISFLEKLPILVPTQEQEEYLTNLADKMLESKEKLSKLNKLLELAVVDKNYEMQLELKEKIEELNEEILDTDYAIDSYVYDMYGITEEERVLIEG